MKEKILHIAETLQGGPATVISSLCLIDEYEHLLVAPGEHENKIELKDVRYFSYARKKRGIVSLFLFIKRALLVCKTHQPDVVHMHSSLAVCAAPFIWFLSQVGAFPKPRMMYQPHGIAYDPNIGNSWIKCALYRLFEKLLCMFVDNIICISNYEKSIITTVHHLDKIYLLQNSVVDSHLNPLKTSELRQGYLFVGRLDRQKGIDLLTEYWATERQECLTVVGQPVLKDCSITQARNISLAGWVSGVELDSLYSSVKALIVPSRWEGFGLVVIEAYRNGTPVIVSNIGALPELVDSGVTGHIIYHTNFYKSMNVAINTMEELDSEDLGIYSRNSRSAYELKFSHSIYEGRVIELYSNNRELT